MQINCPLGVNNTKELVEQTKIVNIGEDLKQQAGYMVRSINTKKLRIERLKIPLV